MEAGIRYFYVSCFSGRVANPETNRVRVLELTLARPSLTMQTVSRLYPMLGLASVYIGGLGF
jgi:hypothetical protein